MLLYNTFDIQTAMDTGFRWQKSFQQIFWASLKNAHIEWKDVKGGLKLVHARKSTQTVRILQVYLCLMYMRRCSPNYG